MYRFWILVAIFLSTLSVADAKQGERKRGPRDSAFAGPYLVGHLKWDTVDADVFVDAATRSSTSTEFDVGVRIGYRWRLPGRWLAGVEAGLDQSEIIEGRTLELGTQGVNFSFEKRGDIYTIDLLAGLQPGSRWLVFGTVGYARTDFSRGAFIFNIGQPPPPEIVTNDRVETTTFGGGAEWALIKRIHLRVAVTKENSKTFNAGEFGISAADLGAAAAGVHYSTAQLKLEAVLQF